MNLPADDALMRVFLDKFQKWHHRPVYEAIVEEARSRHLAGATVFEGVEGFGQSGRILRDRTWSLASNCEVVVEIVDTCDRLREFLAGIEPMLNDAIVTLENAKVIAYRSRGERKQ
jgi:hypothetical protein